MGSWWEHLRRECGELSSILTSLTLYVSHGAGGAQREQGWQLPWCPGRGQAQQQCWGWEAQRDVSAAPRGHFSLCHSRVTYP